MVDEFVKAFQGKGAFPYNLPSGSVPPRAISGQGGANNYVLSIQEGVSKWISASALFALFGTVPVANGGTGISSYTRGDILYAENVTTLNKLNSPGGSKALFSDYFHEPPLYRRINASDVDSGTFPGPGNYVFKAIIRPFADNNALYTVGTPSFRWYGGYFGTEVIIKTDHASYTGSTAPLRVSNPSGSGIDVEATTISVIRYSNTLGATPGFAGVRARGTSSIPLNVLNTSPLVGLNAFGYNGSAFAFGGNYTICAAEDWVAGVAQGTNASTFLTKRGTITRYEVQSSYVESVLFAPHSIWTTSSSPSSFTDSIMLIDVAGTQGINNYGSSITFSSLGQTGLNGGTWNRKASIVAKQVTADPDQIGLTLWIHDSATAATAMSQAWQWNIAGDTNSKAFGHILASADNTWDLADSVTQFKTGYFKTSVITPLVGTITAVNLGLQRNSTVIANVTATGINPGANDTYVLGELGTGWQQLVIQHNVNRAQGILLNQTLTTAPSPRLFFNNSTDFPGAANVVFQTASNTLEFRTGGTIGSGSGTGRWRYDTVAISPISDNAYDLGISATNRFRAIYGYTGDYTTRVISVRFGSATAADVTLERNSTTIATITATQFNLASGIVLAINGTQVMGARITGYTPFTGSAVNRGTAYDTATITLTQLAERVNALQTDLTSLGPIGA